MATSTPTPRLSDGSDSQALHGALARLLAVSAPGSESGAEAVSGSGGRWKLIASGEGIERTFRFKTFAKTWDFMTAVALQCKLKNHHPEWSNVYNTTFIRWTTHAPKGLSAKDIELARLCDELARDFGEVTPQEEEGKAAAGIEAEVEDKTDDVCRLQGLADTAAAKGGDCCTLKGKSS